MNSAGRVDELSGRYAGETAFIVGRGPSLLDVAASAFSGGGPIIVLNRALEQIRLLYPVDSGLPRRVYSQQKDGCHRHTWQTPVAELSLPSGHVCGAEWQVAPVAPEALIVSTAESPFCFEGYLLRYVVDVEADLHLPWYTMSAPVATRLAMLMGAARIVMLGFDSMTRGDTRTVEGNRLVDSPHAGYMNAAVQAKEIAHAAEIPMEWV